MSTSQDGRHRGQRPTGLVKRALAFGEGSAHARPTVPLVGPLAQDRAEQRLAAGRPADRALLLPREDGRAWQDHDWRNWSKRVYGPAAMLAGVADPRPYDLRHVRGTRRGPACEMALGEQADERIEPLTPLHHELE